MRKKALVGFAVLAMLLATAIPAAGITWGEPDTGHTNVGAMVDGLGLPANEATTVKRWLVRSLLADALPAEIVALLKRNLW